MHNKHIDSLKIPLASVIIVTRNRAISLTRALQALQALDYPNYEIIVVDNDSTDNTAQVAAQFSARHIFCPSKRGISYCRQQGVEAARGEIVAFCDDDCIPSSEWLKHLVRRLMLEEDLGLVGGKVINVGFSGGRRFKGRTKLGRNGMLSFTTKTEETDFFGNMNLAFRREVIQSIGGYDPFFNVMEEIDLATRMRRNGYRVDYEPAAIMEHHNAGVFYKKRHLFFGHQLVRLYFYFKHFRPRSLQDWLNFIGYELKLTGRDLIRFIRALAAATFKGRFERYPAIAIELFNLVSSRLVIPWLLWKTRLYTLPAK